MDGDIRDRGAEFVVVVSCCWAWGWSASLPLAFNLHWSFYLTRAHKHHRQLLIPIITNYTPRRFN